MRQLRARLEAIEGALGEQQDYQSDALGVLEDIRGELAGIRLELSEINANTTPEGRVIPAGI